MNIIVLTNRQNKFLSGVEIALGQWRDASGHADIVDVTDEAPSVELLERYDLGVSWFYRHILRPSHLAALRYGVVNSHISHLPFGRGSAPNVWAIYGQEPAGVTLHWIDAGVDTGPIIAQEMVKVEPTDTGESLYRRLCDEMATLFMREWPKFRAAYPNFPQGRPQMGHYETHKIKDLALLDDLEVRFGKVCAHQFVDTLRARTFPGHEAAFVRDEQGRKVYVRVELSYE